MTKRKLSKSEQELQTSFNAASSSFAEAIKKTLSGFPKLQSATTLTPPGTWPARDVGKRLQQALLDTVNPFVIDPPFTKSIQQAFGNFNRALIDPVVTKSIQRAPDSAGTSMVANLQATSKQRKPVVTHPPDTRIRPNGAKILQLHFDTLAAGRGLKVDPTSRRDLEYLATMVLEISLQKLDTMTHGEVEALAKDFLTRKKSPVSHVSPKVERELEKRPVLTEAERDIYEQILGPDAPRSLRKIAKAACRGFTTTQRLLAKDGKFRRYYGVDHLKGAGYFRVSP